MHPAHSTSLRFDLRITQHIPSQNNNHLVYHGTLFGHPIHIDVERAMHLKNTPTIIEIIALTPNKIATWCPNNLTFAPKDTMLKKIILRAFTRDAHHIFSDNIQDTENKLIQYLQVHCDPIYIQRQQIVLQLAYILTQINQNEDEDYINAWLFHPTIIQWANPGAFIYDHTKNTWNNQTTFSRLTKRYAQENEDTQIHHNIPYKTIQRIVIDNNTFTHSHTNIAQLCIIAQSLDIPFLPPEIAHIPHEQQHENHVFPSSMPQGEEEDPNTIIPHRPKNDAPIISPSPLFSIDITQQIYPTANNYIEYQGYLYNVPIIVQLKNMGIKHVLKIFNLLQGYNPTWNDQHAYVEHKWSGESRVDIIKENTIDILPNALNMPLDTLKSYLNTLLQHLARPSLHPNAQQLQLLLVHTIQSAGLNISDVGTTKRAQTDTLDVETNTHTYHAINNVDALSAWAMLPTIIPTIPPHQQHQNIRTWKHITIENILHECNTPTHITQHQYITQMRHAHNNNIPIALPITLTDITDEDV